MTLVAKPKFDDIVARLDTPFEIKKPDRLAKFIIESPTIASFDENLDLEAEERRRAAEQAKEAEIRRVAQESGAPASLLRALENRPASSRIDNTQTNAHMARAIQFALTDATQLVHNAVAYQTNVDNMRSEVASTETGAEFYDIFSEGEVPESQPDPRTVEEQRGITRPNTPEDEAMMDRAWAAQGTGLIDVVNAAGGFLQGVGNVAQGVGSIAQAVAGQNLGLAPPIARGIAGTAMSTARGGVMMSSHAARGVQSAMHTLMAMGMPMRERAELFRPGVNIADGFGHFVAHHRI
jgi:hypothetical protein